MAKAEREPEFLAGMSEFFAGTLQAIVDTLHRTAPELAERRA
jgi:hypothetical protein